MLWRGQGVERRGRGRIFQVWYERFLHNIRGPQAFDIHVESESPPIRLGLSNVAELLGECDPLRGVFISGEGDIRVVCAIPREGVPCCLILEESEKPRPWTETTAIAPVEIGVLQLVSEVQVQLGIESSNAESPRQIWIEQADLPPKWQKARNVLTCMPVIGWTCPSRSQ